MKPAARFLLLPGAGVSACACAWGSGQLELGGGVLAVMRICLSYSTQRVFFFFFSVLLSGSVIPLMLHLELLALVNLFSEHILGEGGC